jgi:hypothetical protein
MTPEVHVLNIHPDLGHDDEDDHGEEEAIDGEGNEDVEKHLEDAFEAAKDDHKEGFLKSMKAAIQACVQEELDAEHEPEGDEEEED